MIKASRLYGSIIVLNIAFWGGAIWDQKYNSRGDDFQFGQPLAIIRAGTSLDSNYWGIGNISGDVYTGQDVAVVLLGSRTLVLPNTIIPNQCEEKTDPIDPEIMPPSPTCPSILRAAGPATISHISIHGNYIGSPVSFDGEPKGDPDAP